MLGLIASELATQPYGEESWVLQVVLGAGIPAVGSFLVARYGANRTRATSLAWALASVVATGAILVLALIYVFTVVRPS